MKIQRAELNEAQEDELLRKASFLKKKKKKNDNDNKKAGLIRALSCGRRKNPFEGFDTSQERNKWENAGSSLGKPRVEEGVPILLRGAKLLREGKTFRDGSSLDDTSRGVGVMPFEEDQAPMSYEGKTCPNDCEHLLWWVGSKSSERRIRNERCAHWRRL